MSRRLGKRQVAECCLDLLLIEMVESTKRTCKCSCISDPNSDTKEEKSSSNENNNNGENPYNLVMSHYDPAHVHVSKVYTNLESMGFQVGQRLVERLTQNQPYFAVPLDIVKFLCKDFWISLFSKQIDKLQTDHKGTYVLYDFEFKWLTRISHPSIAVEKGEAKTYTSFAMGIVRGALSNLNINSTVKVDFPNPPACQFTIVDIETKKKHSSSSASKSSSK